MNDENFLTKEEKIEVGEALDDIKFGRVYTREQIKEMFGF